MNSQLVKWANSKLLNTHVLSVNGQKVTFFRAISGFELFHVIRTSITENNQQFSFPFNGGLLCKSLVKNGNGGSLNSFILQNVFQDDFAWKIVKNWPEKWLLKWKFITGVFWSYDNCLDSSLILTAFSSRMRRYLSLLLMIKNNKRTILFSTKYVTPAQGSYITEVCILHGESQIVISILCVLINLLCLRH